MVLGDVMPRCSAIFRSLALDLLALLFAAAVHAQSNDPAACGLLSRAAIAKATGLDVAEGKEGPHVVGSLSNCIWLGPNGTRVVVTVADADRMIVTTQSQLQAGATQFQGIGFNAVYDGERNDPSFHNLVERVGVAKQTGDLRPQAQ
jgi:hypothetical protein